MAVYRPKRKGEVSKFYVCEFVIQGKRIQESTGTTSKTVAKEYEKRRRAEMERAAAGVPPEQKAGRLRSIAEVTATYLKDYKLSHRASSLVWATCCMAHVNKAFGTILLSDLSEDRIRDYIRNRQAAGAANRTINMELSELGRAIGQRWSLLWPHVKKLEERKDVGRALSVEEQERLLDALKENETPHLRTLIPLLLLTGMRAGEARSLTWGQVDLPGNKLAVGRAKTSSGTGRIIPLNPELAKVLAEHRAEFAERFGTPKPSHFLFAWGSPRPVDPTKAMTGVKHAWDGLRKAAGVDCRLHDLRHTFATRLAENGVPESTMLSLMGHMSRAMLELYSHIRMTAKRTAVAGVSLRQKSETQNSEAVPVIVPVLVRKKGCVTERKRR